MPTDTHSLSILFVCLGNICRSPLAAGLFARHLDTHGLSHRVGVDSAGTQAYLLGEPPAMGSCQVALERGVDISGHRARRICSEDFQRFGMILVMDKRNIRELLRFTGVENTAVIELIGQYSALQTLEIPDPYGQGVAEFEHTAKLLEGCFAGLLKEVRQRLEIN